jgi:putative membrane protein
MVRHFPSLLALAGSVATAFLPTPLHAQDPGSRQTREFIQAAAQSDRFELLEATTALAQSTDPQVKAFATEMITAHHQTSDNLMQAVTKAGLTPPSPGISGDQSMFLASLQSQRGADFDRTYVRQQVLAHRAALAVQQQYAASGDDPAIKQVATGTVPVVASHLRMAEQLQATKSGS